MLVIIVSVILIICTFSINKSLEKTEINGNFYISEKLDKNNYYIYTINRFNSKYLVTSNEEFSLGDSIYIKGIINKFDETKIPNGFNEYKYYLNDGVFGEVNIHTINKNSRYNYFYKILNHLKFKNNLLYSLFTNKSGDNTKINVITNELKSLNIIHFINISGIHIFFILFLLDKLFYNTNVELKQQDVIRYTILLIIYVMSSYSFTILRFIIYQCLISINKHFNLKINNFNLLNFSFLILLILFPYKIYSVSFLISYIIIISLNILYPLFEDDNFYIKSLKINTIICILTIPFINKFNLLSIILSPIFNILFTIILFPLSLVSLISNNILSMSNNMFHLLYKLLLSLNNTNYTINLSTMNNVFLILYYIVLYLLLIVSIKKKLILFLVIVIMLLIPNIKLKLESPYVKFLDVGQADSSVYISSNNVVVIDAYYGVSSYLVSKGIRTINYLVLSHSHDDHMIEANKLIENFNVINVVISGYDNSYNLIYSSKNNIIEIFNRRKISNKELTLDFLSPNTNYNTTNNNSLVLKLIFNNSSILYTGDIEIDTERYLVEKYQEELKSDILKVAHHGSNTSSLDEFIYYANPRYAVISVGLNNKFGFPHIETINTLNKFNVKIYETRNNATIKYKNNKFYTLK